MPDNNRKSSIHDNDPGRGITDKPMQHPTMWVSGVVFWFCVFFIPSIWARWLYYGAGDAGLYWLVTLGTVILGALTLYIYVSEAPKHKARIAKWQAELEAERAERRASRDAHLAAKYDAKHAEHNAQLDGAYLNKIILDTAFYMTAVGNEVTAEQIADELGKKYPNADGSPRTFDTDYITAVCEGAEDFVWK